MASVTAFLGGLSLCSTWKWTMLSARSSLVAGVLVARFDLENAYCTVFVSILMIIVCLALSCKAIIIIWLLPASCVQALQGILACWFFFATCLSCWPVFPLPLWPLIQLVGFTNYLLLWGPSVGSLFICQDGCPLLWAHLLSFLQSALREAGFLREFSGHTFGIGSAATAAQWGIPGHPVGAMGCWLGNACLLWIVSSQWQS